MTWIWVVSIAFFMLKLLMSPPSALVAWGLKKFALHPILDSKDITITFNGKHIEGEEKIRLTDYFNEANVLKKHYIFPGHEQLFLNPDTDVKPFVFNVKRGKKDVNFFVYSYDQHVDVVKQHKKKVVSYSLNSDHLLNFSVSTKG
ncbi:YfmQ family protein [Lysinibacillus sp. NPDC097287]|uniref:YfmQ family protein n=1 Tax=Lysinibacillus sp. NPDC097287 TaxID=3364144 RepID=UPI0037FDA120